MSDSMKDVFCRTDGQYGTHRLVSNYEDTPTWIVFLGVCGMIGASVFGIFQYRRIKRLIVELEKC